MHEGIAACDGRGKFGVLLSAKRRIVIVHIRLAIFLAIPGIAERAPTGHFSLIANCFGNRAPLLAMLANLERLSLGAALTAAIGVFRLDLVTSAPSRDIKSLAMDSG